MAARNRWFTIVPGFTAMTLCVVLVGPNNSCQSADDQDASTDPISAAAQDSEEQRIRQELSSLTELGFNNTPLIEAMQFIGKLHGFDVVLSSEGLEEAGVTGDTPISMRLGGINLSSALEYILDPLDLTYEITDGALLITSKKSLSLPLVMMLDDEQANARIEATLDDLTELGFIDTPLDEAIDFIRHLHNINVLLEGDALEEIAVDSDEPITRKLSEISLASALKILLEPLALTYVVEDGLLKITTHLRAELKYQTRIYDLYNLSQAGYTPEVIEDVIVNLVIGARWEGDETAGGVTVLLPDGLGVRQTYHVHKEIEKLLRLLEQRAKLHAEREEAMP